MVAYICHTWRDDTVPTYFLQLLIGGSVILVIDPGGLVLGRAAWYHLGGAPLHVSFFRPRLFHIFIDSCVFPDDEVMVIVGFQGSREEATRDLGYVNSGWIACGVC